MAESSKECKCFRISRNIGVAVMVQNETSLSRELVEAFSQSLTEARRKFERSFVGHEVNDVLGSMHESPAMMALA